MKKNNILIGLGVVALAIPLALTFSKGEKFINAEAYEVSSLPTTISLKDNTSEEIRNYYSSVSGKRGNELLASLKTVLSTNQKYYGYDSSMGDAIWKMYEITDRDWAKSPAAEIDGYNPSTNTITGYKYNTNPYIHALYVNRDVENETKAWDDHNQTKWGINREHIWPKSQGFNADGKGGARGDPMHLWAGNGRVNGTEHNNHPYGFVDKEKETLDPYTKLGYENLKNNYRGTSKTLGTGTVFEPQDSDKGDIARSIFYMVARYNNVAGNDSNINTDNPNLELVQAAPEKSSYTSTATIPGQMGILSDLLEWNELDPVDEYEIHRNNLLYNNYTNNRNPFIDYPQWANMIWGDDTKSANPANDYINGSPIKVDKISVTIAPEGTGTITANVESGNISWEVADTSIISLDKTSTASGETVTITALKEGSTTITLKVTIDSEEYERVIKVTVAKNAPSDEHKGIEFNTTTIVIIAVVAGVLLIVLIIILATSKKARKKAKSVVKKQVKKQVKNSTKKKK